MARPGVLGDVMSGFLRYDTADDFDRKRLIWVFLVAFLQLVLVLWINVNLITEQAQKVQVDGWVISTRSSGGRKGSYYATVEYYVNSERYQTEFSCDSKTKVGEHMKLCYSPDHPEGAKKKTEHVPICAIFCLFQLWLMARTGIPDHYFGVLAEKIRSSRRRSHRKKRDDDPWDGWRD